MVAVKGNTVTMIEITTDDLRFVAQSLGVLADLDEGEHWDYGRLRELARVLAAAADAGEEEAS